MVERGAGFLLIDGARRVAAKLKLGATGIEAQIEPEEALADAAFVRLGEIKGNMMRGELTVLDRALYLAAWREIYETVHVPAKRGRKPAGELIVNMTNNSGAANDDVANAFRLRFSEAAQRALKLSSKSIYRSLAIATIGAEQARRLVGHPSADNQSEMLLLAEQTIARQAEVIDLLVGGNRRAATVAEAVAFLAGPATTPPPAPYERFHQSFARLRPQDQDAFFDLNAEAIERWNAARSAKGGKRLRSVA